MSGDPKTGSSKDTCSTKLLLSFSCLYFKLFLVCFFWVVVISLVADCFVWAELKFFFFCRVTTLLVYYCEENM